MLRSKSVTLRESKLEVPENLSKKFKKWEGDNMYRTSYFQQHQKNV